MHPHAMTGRELAAVCFRIVGVVLLLTGIAQTLLLVTDLGRGDFSTWALTVGASILLSLFFLGAIVLPLIFHSEKLVGWVFPPSEATVELAISRRDLVACGLAVVGAWTLGTNLPQVARVAGEILWYLGGERRSQLTPDFLERAGFNGLDAVFYSLAGWLLFRYSVALADWWENRSKPARGPSASEEG